MNQRPALKKDDFAAPLFRSSGTFVAIDRTEDRLGSWFADAPADKRQAAQAPTAHLNGSEHPKSRENTDAPWSFVGSPQNWAELTIGGNKCPPVAINDFYNTLGVAGETERNSLL